MAGRGADRCTICAELRRGAAKTVCSTGTPHQRHSCPRSSGPPLGRGSVTGIWNLSTTTARERGSGGCTACSPVPIFPSPVYGVATALARSPQQVEANDPRPDWEIASHGLKWIDYKDHTAEVESANMDEAIRLHREVVGPRSPRLVHRTQLCEHGGAGSRDRANSIISLTHTTMICPTGHRWRAAIKLIIPYTLDCNDMRFATPQGFNSGEQFYTYLCDTFDALYAEGSAGQGKMMSVGLHCRLIGRPGRIQALKRFIDYIKGFEGVWTPRRIDIAEPLARDPSAAAAPASGSNGPRQLLSPNSVGVFRTFAVDRGTRLRA